MSATDAGPTVISLKGCVNTHVFFHANRCIDEDAFIFMINMLRAF